MGRWEPVGTCSCHTCCCKGCAACDAEYDWPVELAARGPWSCVVHDCDESATEGPYCVRHIKRTGVNT